MRARTWTAVVTLVAGLAVMSWPAAAGAATDGKGRDPRTVTVTATGLIRGTPDVLELSVGVETHARSAVEALDRNSALARKVIGVLRDVGVESDDIQTSFLSVSPVYDENGEHLEGYAVSNVVAARIRDLSRAGEVIDAATKVAGDEILIQGVSFSFADNTELVAQARADAVKRARTQADQLARAAGVGLGDLLSITEEGAPVGPVLESRLAATDASGAPIEPGSQELSVQVTLVYELT